MFVAHQVALNVSLGAAQARLANLARGRGLSEASEAAYKDGFAGLVRVGPLGDVPGASKLVQVSFLDPVYSNDVMTLALRWEATGVTSGLFPCWMRTSRSYRRASRRRGWRWRAPTGRRWAASAPTWTGRS